MQCDALKALKPESSRSRRARRLPRAARQAARRHGAASARPSPGDFALLSLSVALTASTLPCGRAPRPACRPSTQTNAASGVPPSPSPAPPPAPPCSHPRHPGTRGTAALPPPGSQPATAARRPVVCAWPPLSGPPGPPPPAGNPSGPRGEQEQPAAAPPPPLPPPPAMAHQGSAVQPPAQEDQPVLPANFFTDPATSGPWNGEADVTEGVESGKGKVRACSGGGGGCSAMSAAGAARPALPLPGLARQPVLRKPDEQPGAAYTSRGLVNAAIASPTAAAALFVPPARPPARRTRSSTRPRASSWVAAAWRSRCTTAPRCRPPSIAPSSARSP